VEQVLVRVAREAKLGEHHDSGTSVGGSSGERQDALRIERGIGYAHGRNGGRNPGEAMRVQRPARQRGAPCIACVAPSRPAP
jgi:hypothetical protein